MHRQITRGEIEQRRDDGRLDDLGIRHVDGLGHDERHRAHHGRHDLAAHRGCGLDAAGEGRRKSEPLHERNGELPRRHHVGDAGPGYRSHQRRGGDADLAGPALSAAEGRHRDVVEEIDDAGLFHEGPEENEQEDVSGGNEGRHRVDALRAVRHMLDDLLQCVAAMIEGGWEPVAEDAIGEKHRRDDGQRDAHHLPDEIDQDQQRRDAQHHVELRQVAGSNHELVVETPLIEPDSETRDADGPAENSSRGRRRAVIGHHRAGDEAEETDVKGAHHLARQRSAELDDEAERDRDGDPRQRAVQDAAAPHRLENQPTRPQRHGHAKEMIEGNGRNERRIEGDAEGRHNLKGGK